MKRKRSRPSVPWTRERLDLEASMAEERLQLVIKEIEEIRKIKEESREAIFCEGWIIVELDPITTSL